MNMGERDVYMNMRRENCNLYEHGRGRCLHEHEEGEISLHETVEGECSLHEHGEEGMWSI